MSPMTSASEVVTPPVRQRLAGTLTGGRPSPARVRIALLAIVIVFVALGSFIAVKTPAWESSDEPGHVLNIETIASGHWYHIDLNCPATPRTTILSCSGDEPQQAPLYYLLMAGWQRVVGLPVQVPPTQQLRFANENEVGEFFLQHPDHGFLIWLRLPNVILGAATIAMTFLAARLVSRDNWTPVIAAALVAFLPGFLFHSAFVTNDSLVNLLGAVLTFCALRFIQSFSSRWIVATGAVYGLLLTTKLSVVPLALIVPFVALMAPTWRRRLVLFAYGTLSALAVSVWYLIQNWARYGDPLARHATLTYLIRDGALGLPDGVSYVVTDPLDLIVFYVPNKIASNVWYSSGWGQFHWSQATGYLITFVLLVALVGLINQRIPNRVLLTLGAIGVLSLGCVWLLAFQTAAYGARFAYVGIAPIAVLVALALQRWPLAIRCILPAVGLMGCLVAIHQNVLGVHWTT